MWGLLWEGAETLTADCGCRARWEGVQGRERKRRGRMPERCVQAAAGGAEIVGVNNVHTITARRTRGCVCGGDKEKREGTPCRRGNEGGRRTGMRVRFLTRSWTPDLSYGCFSCPRALARAEIPQGRLGKRLLTCAYIGVMALAAGLRTCRIHTAALGGYRDALRRSGPAALTVLKPVWEGGNPIHDTVHSSQTFRQRQRPCPDRFDDNVFDHIGMRPPGHSIKNRSAAARPSQPYGTLDRPP